MIWKLIKALVRRIKALCEIKHSISESINNVLWRIESIKNKAKIDDYERVQISCLERELEDLRYLARVARSCESAIADAERDDRL